MEVHAHVRTAKPRVALFFSAIVLGGMLALAQWQVIHETGLLERVSIPGSELSFQPPRGWTPSEREPGVYELLMPEADGALKRLRLSFGRTNAPIPHAAGQREVQLGDLSAIQTKTQLRRGRIIWNVVHRVAVTPRGEALSMRLESLARINLGDLDMLNAVSATVRVGQGGLTQPKEEFQDRLGITASIPSEWLAFQAWHPSVPGGYLAPPTTLKQRWSLELTRTFTAHLTAEELLKRACGVRWESTDITISHGKTPTGMTILRALPDKPLEDRLVAYWLLHKDDQKVILARWFVDLSEDLNASAAAVEQFLQTVSIEADYPTTPIPELQDRGESLVNKLRRGGPSPWWGREPVSLFFMDQRSQQIVYAWTQGALNGEPTLGYAGQMASLSPRRGVRSVWQMTPRSSYTWELDWYSRGVMGTRQSEQVREIYDADSDSLSRESDQSSEQRWSVPKNFLPVPLETIAFHQIARGAVSESLVSISDGDSPGIHGHLLTRLEPDSRGRVRILVQRSISPGGYIYTFREGAELHRIQAAEMDLQRITRDAAVQAFPSLEAIDQLRTISPIGR